MVEAVGLASYSCFRTETSRAPYMLFEQCVKSCSFPIQCNLFPVSISIEAAHFSRCIPDKYFGLRAYPSYTRGEISWQTTDLILEHKNLGSRILLQTGASRFYQKCVRRGLAGYRTHGAACSLVSRSFIVEREARPHASSNQGLLSGDNRGIGYKTSSFGVKIQSWKRRRGPTAPRMAWWDSWFRPEAYTPPSGWSSTNEEDGPKEAGSFGDIGKDRRRFRNMFRRGDDLIGDEEDDVDGMLADDERFTAWATRRQAYNDLEEFKENGLDTEDQSWEDWLDDDIDLDMGGWFEAQSDWENSGMPREPRTLPERGMSRTYKEFLFRIFQNQDEVEDDLTLEERIFRYTSRQTAKFVACLVLVPWLTGVAMHDFVFVPFVHRWVETVPLAAKMLDVRESQKLEMVDRLKLERQRVRFEAEVGITPPLSDTDLADYMHEEAKDMREEVRAENQSTFANIWSDIIAGLVGFCILVFNPRQVTIMRLTGSRIFTNISDTGKAFIIILLTDIFLGYHSQSGWETVIELFLDHYGLESDISAIHLFVAIVPVTIDACFKLWVFRYLNRLSPSAAATFREMKRH
eukprot:jgi/Mesen1/1131/ME000123S00296